VVALFKNKLRNNLKVNKYIKLLKYRCEKNKHKNRIINDIGFKISFESFIYISFTFIYDSIN